MDFPEAVKTAFLDNEDERFSKAAVLIPGQNMETGEPMFVVWDQPRNDDDWLAAAMFVGIPMLPYVVISEDGTVSDPHPAETLSVLAPPDDFDPNAPRPFLGIDGNPVEGIDRNVDLEVAAAHGFVLDLPQVA